MVEYHREYKKSMAKPFLTDSCPDSFLGQDQTEVSQATAHLKRHLSFFGFFGVFLLFGFFFN